MVERGGFEPPKAEPADLQSAPFDRSGTSPVSLREASEGNRTPDPLITSQLLYRLSYAGVPEKKQKIKIIPLHPIIQSRTRGTMQRWRPKKADILLHALIFFKLKPFSTTPFPIGD
jgi:hypothetical protein